MWEEESSKQAVISRVKVTASCIIHVIHPQHISSGGNGRKIYTVSE
jgi:hypothetical protein